MAEAIVRCRTETPDNTWQDGSMRCIGTVAGGRAAKPSLRRRRVRDRFWTHSHASQNFWRNDGGTVQSPARTSSHRACCTETGKGSVSPVTRTEVFDKSLGKSTVRNTSRSYASTRWHSPTRPASSPTAEDEEAIRIPLRVSPIRARSSGRAGEEHLRMNARQLRILGQGAFSIVDGRDPFLLGCGGCTNPKDGKRTHDPIDSKRMGGLKNPGNRRNGGDLGALETDAARVPPGRFHWNQERCLDRMELAEGIEPPTI